MPNVPYNPVPSVGPSGGPASPYLRVPAGTEEAAGVGIGRAVQGFGHEIDKASNTLSQEVLQLQGLQNETDAKNADVDVMIKIGQAQSEFDQLEGDNSVKALPGHMDRIKKIRQDALDSMPNPMARKMLDQSISRRVGFSIVDSGHKAGTQARLANRQARQARVETAISTGDPSNPGSMRAAEETISGEIDQLGQEMGAKPETIANIKRKDISKLWLSGLSKMAPNDPLRAKELFDEKKDDLDPQTREAAQTIVNRNMTAHQTRNDADEIFSRKNFDPMQGPGQLQGLLDLGKKYAEKYGQDNADYSDTLDSRIRNKFNVAMQGYKDAQTGHEYTIGKYILGQDDASRVVDIDGIVGPKAPPEVRVAYNALEPPAQRRVNNWIAQLAKGGSVGWTTEGLRRFNVLKGMASDPETRKDFYEMGPEAILSEHLPIAAKRQLLDVQREIAKQPTFMNGIVDKAMKQVAGILGPAGVTLAQDREGYLQFRGAFSDVIQDYMGDNKKIPPEKEMNAIASRLLQDQYKDTWWKFKSPLFKGGDIPDDIRTEVTAEYKKRFQIDPTEEQLQRAYSLILYKRLYEQQKQEPPGTKKPK